MDDEKLIKNKWYRAYKKIPLLQKSLDHERDVNHKLYEYAKNIESSLGYLTTDIRIIKELMKKILIVDGRPVKNTTKKQCYEVLEEIQEIVGSNK